MKMGYYQIEMMESARKITAFVTTDGHYEYNRMPFGLVNAPAVFQSLMNRLVSELGHDQIVCYLDDVIIPSRTITEGLDLLQRYLDLLRKHGLTLRLDKCAFLHTEIDFLGHRVGPTGISPGRQKTQAIELFPKPKNVTEVRRFLGLTGFFRKFVANYSLIAEPLTLLLQKDQPFIWGDEQERAFTMLKDKLTCKPVLEVFNFNAEHEVHCDASSVGLAGILLQSTDGKTFNPVLYYSRHCTEVESKYPSFELEVLAVVESLERFRVYILGKPFKVVTDCDAITTMKSKTEPNRRIAR